MSKLKMRLVYILMIAYCETTAWISSFFLASLVSLSFAVFIYIANTIVALSISSQAFLYWCSRQEQKRLDALNKLKKEVEM